MGGRLSQEDIEKMVADAEKFKAQDDIVRKKVEAKNGFEHYCFQMKNTLNEEKLKAAANEGLQFLESDPDTEAIEAKQKELEAKFNPIMMRVYQAAGPEGAAGGMPSGASTGGAAAAPADAPMDDLD